MSRLVETVSAGAKTASRSNPKDGIERIAKYIPAEILAFYTMWTQAAALLPIKSADPDAPPPDSLVFPEGTVTIACLVGLVLGAILTYAYFDRFFPDAKPESRRYHRVISPIAFLIYGYTIWGAVDPSYFVPGIALMATAVLTLGTFLAQPVASPPPAGG